MQLPSSKTPIATCEASSLYAETMCSKFPERTVLIELATSLREARTALTQSQTAYRAAVLALLPLRVEVRFVDYLADLRVRRTFQKAELADGKRGGKICAQVFAKGLTPIVKPVGATEVSEMRSLEGRLEAAAAHWAEAAAEKAEITALRERYEGALVARKAGAAKAADLRAARDAVKEDFLDVFAIAAARVKTEFPRDRAMQDLFFDRINAGRSAPEDSEDPIEPVEPDEPVEPTPDS
jgi:hypothetical protein